MPTLNFNGGHDVGFRAAHQIFDEAATSDTANGGGKVSPVFWGPNVKVGFTQTSTTLYQHQSMLRTVTVMDALRLSNPPGAAASAPSMSEFFVQK
jgi:hypothetical protein